MSSGRHSFPYGRIVHSYSGFVTGSSFGTLKVEFILSLWTLWFNQHVSYRMCVLKWLKCSQFERNRCSIRAINALNQSRWIIGKIFCRSLSIYFIMWWCLSLPNLHANGRQRIIYGFWILTSETVLWTWKCGRLLASDKAHGTADSERDNIHDYL